MSGAETLLEIRAHMKWWRTEARDLRASRRSVEIRAGDLLARLLDAIDATCASCGNPVDGYDSSGRGLCHDCDQEHRYELASEPPDAAAAPPPATVRRSFEIRKQRNGKYAIVVLDDSTTLVRGEPTIRQARALMSAYWRDVQWTGETRGSFEAFES